MGANVLTLDDLAKGALAENIEDKIPEMDEYGEREEVETDLWPSSPPRRSLT
jgi:hypothetical protein